MVDRYTPMYAETATDRYCHMLQSPTGSFVPASDYDALAARLAEAIAWIDRHGCGDDCRTWESDTLNPPMLINSGPCTCGRQEILAASLTVSEVDK